MKINLKALLISVLISVSLACLISKASAQVSTYNFTQNNGNYSPITGGITIGTGNDDGTIYDSISIGFNFNFNGKTYDMINISTNGFIVMGPDTGAIPFQPGTNILATGNTMNNAIAIFNTDLALGSFITANATAGSNLLTGVTSTAGMAVGDIIDPNGTFITSGTTITGISNDTITMSNVSFSTFTQSPVEFANGEMRMQVLGTAPNRVCVIQWKNARKSANENEAFNFQIRLHENTGKVEAIYNILQYNNIPSEVQVGLTGNSRSDFNIRTTTNNWTATTAATTNIKTCSTSVNVIPPPGYTFAWTPCVLPTIPIPGATNTVVCEGASTTLTILSGNLNSATDWTWYSDSCNGNVVGVGNSITVTPSTNTTYYVRGTGGCPSTNAQCGSIAINVISSPTISVSANPASAVYCSGASVTLTASGANSYSWSNGITNGVSFVPPSGVNIYTVTGIGSNGCTASTTYTITVDTMTSVQIQVSPSNTICSGQSLTLNATNLVNPSWSGGVTNNTPFTPTTSATYTVTGSNNVGCPFSATTSVVLNATPTITVTSVPASGSVCQGSPITLNASGASTYSWSNGVGNGTAFLATTSQTYTVTGTAANGCTATATYNVNVTILNVNVTVNPSNATVCAGQQVTLNATGGTSHVWTGGVVNNVPFTPASTNNYTVTVSGSGCSKTSSVLVTVNALPNVIIQSIPASATVCPGGSVTLNAIGATSYVWSPAITNNVGFIPTSTGVYTVTGTNAAGCTKTATRTVTVNPAPTISVSSTPSNATVCFGGSMVLNATTNGTSLVWSPSYTNNTVFTPASSGVFTVTATASNSCTSTSTVAVTVNPLPNIGTTAIPANYQVCLGSPITINGTGGVTYTYSGNIVNGQAVIVNATSTYTVTGTDNNGCVNTNTFNITVNPLPVLSITAIPANAAVCNGSPLILTASGATSYSWTNNVTNGVPFIPQVIGSYTVTGIDNNGCVGSAIQFVDIFASPSLSILTTPSPAEVCSGDNVTLDASGAATITWSSGVTNNTPFAPVATSIYTATGVDNNGCSNTATVEVTVFPTPTVNVVNNLNTNSVCPGASITFNSTGADFIFWDHDIFEGIPFSPTATDVYTVTGIDNNSCFSETIYTLTVLPAPIVSVSASPNNGQVCPGSIVTFTPSGASTYSWNPAISTSNTVTVNGAATYTVTGTNANGCSATSTVSVSNVNNLTLTITANPSSGVFCAGQSVVLTASGASTYTWTPNISNGVSFTPTASTVYTVTGTSAQGCVSTATFELTLATNPTISIAATPTNAVVCSGSPLTLTASGASTYSWSPNITNGVPFNPTTAGTYTVTGTNASGCTATKTIAIGVNAKPNVVLNSNPSSGNVCIGSSFAMVAAGADTYTFNPAYTNGTFTICTTTTTYTVTGTSNSTGCTNTATRLITALVPPAPPVITPATNPTLCANNTLVVTSTAPPGTTKSWSPNLTEGVAFFPSLGVKMHVLTATASNGCTSKDTIVITGLALPTITASKSPSGAVCFGSTITITPSGGVSYGISPALGTSAPFAGQQPPVNTIYTVTGTGANGCTRTTAVTANLLVVPNFTLTATPSTVCQGAPLTLSSSAVTGNTYSYTPVVIGTTTINPVNNVSFSAPSATVTYTVTATNTNGCTSTKVITPTVLVTPTISLSTQPPTLSTTPICAGTSVILNASATPTTATISYNPTITNGAVFTPTQSTIYTITASNSNGCSRTSTINLQVNPVPTVSATISDSIVCAGTPVTITASGTGTLTTISGGVTSGVAFTPTASAVYTVTSTNANGCQSTTTVAVTVNSTPTLSVTQSPSSGTVCQGNSVIFNAVSSGATISWSGGITNATAFTPTATTVYTVTATSPTGCSTATTRLITVNPRPVISSSILPSNSECLGSSYTITLSSSIAATFSVSNNSFTSGVGFTPPGSAVYTVTATSTQGCISTTTVSIIAKSLPTVTVTSPSSNNLCIGQSYNFIATTNTGTVAWNPPVVNPTTITTNTTTNYTVTATAPNGCTNSLVRNFVIQISPVLLGIYSPNDSLCHGSTFTLTAQSGSPGLSITSIAFTGTGLTTISTFERAGIATSTNTINPTTRNIIITANFSNGCSKQIFAPLVTYPLPTVPVVNGANGTFCPQSSVTLTATNTGGPSPITYAWSGGVTNGVAFSAPNVNTVYTVTASSNFGCSMSATANLQVYTLPTLTITPVTQTVNLGSTAVITASGASSYVWSGSIQNGVSFTPTQSNIYTVTATDANNCTQTETAEVIVNIPKVITLPIQDLASIYPNPFMSSTQLNIQSVSNSNSIIQVSNQNGQVIRRIHTEVFKGDNVIPIDLEQEASGIYFVDVQVNEQRLDRIKIVKQ